MWRKVILMLLVGATVLNAVLLSGCSLIVPADGPTTDPTANEVPTIPENTEAQGTENNAPIEPFLIPDELYLEWYIQILLMSSAYPIDLAVKEGKVYLNGALYDEVTYNDAFELSAGPGLYEDAQNKDLAHAYSREWISDLHKQGYTFEDILREYPFETPTVAALDKIIAQKGIYLFSKSDDPDRPRKGLCKIDGTFYLLLLTANGEIYRVHKGTID